MECKYLLSIYAKKEYFDKDKLTDLELQRDKLISYIDDAKWELGKLEGTFDDAKSELEKLEGTLDDINAEIERLSEKDPKQLKPKYKVGNLVIIKGGIYLIIQIDNSFVHRNKYFYKLSNEVWIYEGNIDGLFKYQPIYED